ncbi:hypothetical protein QRX28_19905, partial [Escherichia coli]|nr:hypothetical protein [Escherichia coli]
YKHIYIAINSPEIFLLVCSLIRI